MKHLPRKAVFFRYPFLFLVSLLLNQVAQAGVIVNETFILKQAQFPGELSRTNAPYLFLFVSGSPDRLSAASPYLSLNRDTVLNLPGFIKFLGDRGRIDAYRLVYAYHDEIDSLYDYDTRFRVVRKIYKKNNFLSVLEFDSTAKVKNSVAWDWQQKIRSIFSKDEKNDSLTRKKKSGWEKEFLPDLLRSRDLGTLYPRKEYSPRSVWMLSIGIDDYGFDKFKTCQSDAEAYIGFFQKQSGQSLFNGQVLVGKQATRQAILEALKGIAARAGMNDNFIFNFSGMSVMLNAKGEIRPAKSDAADYSTYFIPYDVVPESSGTLVNRDGKDQSAPLNNLISLKELQEYIQLIPCNNQLFISEAGHSEKFKTEFIRTMMQNSPTLASLLNVNRVIIVPNKIGMDYTGCNGRNIAMGPLAYTITSLDSTLGIYDIFLDNDETEQIVYKLKSKLFDCYYQTTEYFDVFFERKFLQQYREIFGDPESKTRGTVPSNKEIQKIPGFSGNRYALIIGTDHYKSRDWDKLENPVYDATEIASVLEKEYGFSVRLLKDPPMDSINKALINYYKTLRPTDQLVIYFAGHGDFDEGLLDDGFIVCADSKPIEEDPLRNTYIQHTKLKKMINKIPARQIMVLLDVCHGGVFDEDVLGKTRDNPASSITNRNVLELLNDKSKYITRKMLSSVGKESAFDGKAGKHSPFAAYLLKILLARGGTEGIITLSDIYALLQKASLNETATLKISPHVAGFGDNDPLSEFILIPVDQKK